MNRRLRHTRHNVLRLGYDIFLHRLGTDFQSVTLADIEDVVKAKQIFFLLLAGFLVFTGRLFPKDDGTRLLALANTSAKL